jgi:hypothetical protein
MEDVVSKGFLVLAKNTDSVNYVEQAYALALSIKFSQKNIKNISLVTNNFVPEEYASVFDKILPIPWIDEEKNSLYVAEDRWKLYHVTPYEETIVLDTDMLVLEDITEWWEYCKNFDITFCSRIKNYKLEYVKDSYYRKMFVANKLTNSYVALHYFKKSDTAYNFYKVLEFVCNNWEWCYTTFAPNEYQNWLSLDVAVAIAIEIIGNHQSIVNDTSPLEFIHMKPALQNWSIVPASWQDTVPYVLNSKGDLIVGNIKQSKIFHYVEKDFLTTTILNQLKRLAYE